MVLHDPAAYTGSIVIWGGIIMGIANRPDGTALAVLETPLKYEEMPESSEYSQGLFIAATSLFLDPEVFKRGRMVTVAGEITGRKTRPLGKTKVNYTYPVIGIKQIVLWSIMPEYAYPPDYCWYGGPDDFWPDEGRESGTENEGRENEERERGNRYVPRSQ